MRNRNRRDRPVAETTDVHTDAPDPAGFYVVVYSVFLLFKEALYNPFVFLREY